MEYSHDVIHNALGAQQSHGVSRVTIYLKDGDTAWNPADKDRRIEGPATVMYELSQRDGLVSAYIN